ncbi:MAG: thiamine pyrophosphate-dependent dehydrogenase E1 component subunit alpha [Hyphomicrobiaceae bacterium]
MSDAMTGADAVVARFEIRRRRYLDEAGQALTELPAFATDQSLMRRIYEGMRFIRLYDQKRVNLQRTGRMGTSATALGQEAIPIGIASAMRAEDVLVPSYREDGAQIWRGVKPEEMLIYWGGNEAGQHPADPRVAQDFPVSITVGNHALHAAGVATAFKLREQKRAAVCVFGDGATSKGDVYEAMNVAGVWKLPVVFVISNNGYAISTALENQTACETLAQKGLAGGLTVTQVDGNDIFAVRQVMLEALERARKGEGATLVECLTYRLNDHNTADDSTRYRNPEEVKARWDFCPLRRLKAWMVARGFWSEADETALEARIGEELERAVQAYLDYPPPKAGEMFTCTYATLPVQYEAERAEAVRLDHG